MIWEKKHNNSQVFGNSKRTNWKIKTTIPKKLNHVESTKPPKPNKRGACRRPSRWALPRWARRRACARSHNIPASSSPQWWHDWWDWRWASAVFSWTHTVLRPKEKIYVKIAGELRQRDLFGRYASICPNSGVRTFSRLPQYQNLLPRAKHEYGHGHTATNLVGFHPKHTCHLTQACQSRTSSNIAETVWLPETTKHREPIKSEPRPSGRWISSSAWLQAVPQFACPTGYRWFTKSKSTFLVPKTTTQWLDSFLVHLKAKTLKYAKKSSQISRVKNHLK